MGQPFPPAGGQQQYTERPLKIYGEHYVTGGPLPVGATTETANPVYADGRPHVILPGGVVKELHPGEWVISNRYTGAPVDVISDEEFTERFGGGGPPAAEHTGGQA